MKKTGFILALLLLVAIFTVLNMGGSMGMGYDKPGKADEVVKPIETEETEEKEEENPPIEEEIPAVLTKANVLELIANRQIAFVDEPDDILVLVNKEKNLEADYVPQDLVIPEIPFSFDGYDQKKNLREVAARALEGLINQAHAEGHLIYGLSGYRSYERQESLFVNYALRDGYQKANIYSALPGQSEHQTGLAMDVTSASVDYVLRSAFGDTPEGIWLKDNCHIFGFIIRYPKDKTHITGYQYEPWHIRYVGVEVATEIMLNDLTLEEYCN